MQRKTKVAWAVAAVVFGGSAMLGSKSVADEVPSFMQEMNETDETAPEVSEGQEPEDDAPAEDVFAEEDNGNEEPDVVDSSSVEPIGASSDADGEGLNDDPEISRDEDAAPTGGEDVVTLPSEGMADPEADPDETDPAMEPHEMRASESEYLEEMRDLQRQSELMELRNHVLEQRRTHQEIQREMNQRQAEQRARQSQPSQEVQQLRRQVRAMEEELTGGDLGSAYDDSLAPDEEVLADMHLVSVYGDARNPRADVIYGGGRMSVQRGDMLPGDWQIQRVERSRILVQKGMRRFEIGVEAPGSGMSFNVSR